MAVITAGAFALDFDQLDLSSLIAGTVTVATNGQISTSDSGIVDSFFGSFQYNGAGSLSGGTMTHLTETYFGQTVFDIAGVNVPVTTFLSWALNNDNASAKAYILAGADQITGSAVGDLLRGLTGNDSISGGAGNDTLDGGAGDDSVFGGTGDDIILDASGSNYLRGDDGNDTISGGSGFDDINGNAGNDTAHGNAGDDWVVGGKDNDVLYGDAGNDIVYGNLGDDTISGGDGNDWVRGGQGNDSVSGGAGDDLIYGDRGNDTISGGAGADTFRSFSGAGIDRVIDFSRAEGDHVQLDPGTAYTVSQVGADTVIDMGNGDQMILVGVTLSTLSPGWIGVG